MSHLNREVMQDFIEIYKSKPCLWMMSSKQYHNRKLKKAAYVKLIEKLKILDPAANRERVVKKINNLRTNYRKELRKVMASNDYVPALWYFEKLRFLNDQEAANEIAEDDDEVQEDESVTNAETTDNDTETWSTGCEPMITLNSTECKPTITLDSAVHSSEEHRPQCARSNILPDPQLRPCCLLDNKPKTEVANEILISVEDSFKRPREARQEDRFDIFGKIVATKLREIDKTQRILVEKIINDALFEAEMGTLTTAHASLLHNTQQFLNATTSDI